jgi:glutathione synthase/RimK-type ligase-like ATP-grasp enzyme
MGERPLVLLWGLEADPPIAAVRAELHSLRVPYHLVDQRQVLETEIRLEVGDSVDGLLRTQNEKIDLASVSAVYVRPYNSSEIPAIARSGPDSAAWRHALEVDDVMAAWLEIAPAFVVNPLAAMASNDSKPYQSRQILSHGFCVPETLITTDPAAAQAFWEHHGVVVYKSVSGIRSQVARLRPEHIPRLADVTSCPTQFQKYVAGIEYRVHVVGDQVFAAEVLCEADDYRYPGAYPIEIRGCRLPESVEERCRRLAAAAQLPVAGLDLRRTKEDRWYCFEVNPSPGFTYYESATGQPIARSVAMLLSGRRNLGAGLQPHCSMYDEQCRPGTPEFLC